MNFETLAALSPCHGLFDASTIEAVNKMRPLAGISITAETLRACNRLADVITPEMTLSMAALEQHSKLAKLLDSTLRGPPRR